MISAGQPAQIEYHRPDRLRHMAVHGFVPCADQGDPIQHSLSAQALFRRSKRLLLNIEDIYMAGGTDRFAAGLDNVHAVLSGMSSLAQMDDNLKTMKNFRPLNEAEMQLIRRAQQALDADKSIPCTSCHYCTKGCPMEIPIPEIFNVINRRKGSPEFRTIREYTIVTSGRGTAGKCIARGQCESACPQGLAVVSLLRKCAEELEK